MQRIAAYTVAAAALLALQGCWFVFIPGSLLAGERYYCVGPSAKVGDEIRLNDGRRATVTAIHGPYDRCDRDYPGRYPIKADLAFQ